MFTKGRSGNPGGRPKGPSPKTVLIQQLKERTDADFTQLEEIVAKLISEAKDGKQWAIELIFDRLDGKVPQEQQVTGYGRGPIQVESYQYGLAVAAITAGSDSDRFAPIEAQVLSHGPQVGQDNDGG